MANKVDYSPREYYGNGISREFSFDWKVLEKSDLIVSLVVGDVATVLTLGSDYQAVIDTVGGSVKLAVAPQENEKVRIERFVSNYQSKRYSTSTGFQGKEIEKSFDRVSCNIQDMEHEIQVFKTEFAGEVRDDVEEIRGEVEEVKEDFDRIVEQVNTFEQVANELVTLANETVETATEQVELATEQAELAKQYAQQASIGFVWQEFSKEQWEEREDGIFYLELDVLAVVGVYNENKQLLFPVDVQFDDELGKTVLSALEALDGYVLCTLYGTSEDEDNNEFTEEELQELIVDDWDDVDSGEIEGEFGDDFDDDSENG